MSTAAAPTTRDEVVEMIRKLPDDAAVADIMAALYARQAVEEGLRQLDHGQGIPHAEVMKRVAKWLA
jgi:predicted transcriptional regulator